MENWIYFSVILLLIVKSTLLQSTLKEPLKSNASWKQPHAITHRREVFTIENSSIEKQASKKPLVKKALKCTEELDKKNIHFRWWKRKPFLLKRWKYDWVTETEQPKLSLMATFPLRQIEQKTEKHLRTVRKNQNKWWEVSVQN